MLKQVFGQNKEVQEEIMLLFNIFSNRLNDFIDSSNKEDIISRRPGRNAISL